MNRRSKITIWALALVATAAATSCGETNSHKVSLMGVELKESFLTWSPSPALIARHTSWHDFVSCDNTGATGRKCTPYRGRDFLQFHRWILNQLRDEYLASGGSAADITPWTRLPPEVKSSQAWLDRPELPQKEASIFSLINTDGTTPLPFLDLEGYGQYVERSYHDLLHGIVGSIPQYNAADVIPPGTSPRSTFFFKIHGLVEYLYQRFERGDFNEDGISDVVERNYVNGTNSVRLMPTLNTPNASNDVIDTVPPGGCNWYVGAVADLDYDGINDLVWHGPACGAVSVWKMARNATTGDITRVTSLDITAPNGTPLTTAQGWTLIGSGDYNYDLRPDLIWRNNATLDTQAWILNKTVRQTWIDADIPAGYTPVAMVDLFDDGVPDYLFQIDSGGLKTYHYYSMGYSFGSVGPLGPPGPLTGIESISIYTQFKAAGRFGTSRYTGDLLFETHNPGGANYRRALTNGLAQFVSVPGATISDSVSLQGPL